MFFEYLLLLFSEGWDNLFDVDADAPEAARVGIAAAPRNPGSVEF
jgi:hypothetical protein